MSYTNLPTAMSAIPTVFSYKEPFATSIKSQNKDYAKVDEEIRNEVAGSVLEFLKTWPSTRLIRMNGATAFVGETAMRVAELKVVIDHADTKTHAGGLGAGSWEWEGHGNCEVTVQSIG